MNFRFTTAHAESAESAEHQFFLRARRALRALPCGSTAGAALAIGVAAFTLYRLTLLPDFDFGDTPSFQTMAGRLAITPRDGYPLYYAVGSLFVPFAGTRAHAMNLASAVEAAAASGIIVLVAAELSGSVLAAVAATLMFAGSYTFWSQAVIAEVYALHILFVALALLFILRWSERPTVRRLAWFFALYALGFGNHLSMILLAPAFAIFVFASARFQWRSIVSPRVVGLALIFAALGALQYVWNFSALSVSADPPHSLREAFQIFWFDVTKSDWRDTMVLRVPRVMAGERLRMYGFDLLEQLGWIGVGLAIAGAGSLFRRDWRRGLLIAGVYVATFAFALGYNVGDVHVFFLPATLMLALFAACGITAIGRSVSRWTSAVAIVAIAVAAARIYHDYPALDRSRDNRPTALLNAMTSGLDDRNVILLTDLNWQIQNGLTYYGQEVRPELAYIRLPEVTLYAPALIRDNLAIRRDVVLTDRAKRALDAAYGPLFSTIPDSRFPRVTLDDLTRDLPAGTRYVMCVLKPTREFAIDGGDFARAIRRLTNNDAIAIEQDRYAVLAGLAGQPPALKRSSIRPFATELVLGGVHVDVRMDSWLEFDTIRRMGFGHVITRGSNRHHALIVERGISFVTIDADGLPVRLGYVAGIFEHEGRHLIKR